MAKVKNFETDLETKLLKITHTEGQKNSFTFGPLNFVSKPAFSNVCAASLKLIQVVSTVFHPPSHWNLKSSSQC